MENVQVISSSTLSLHISSSISVNSCFNQRRFNKSISIGELKDKLELVTGIPASFMELEIYTEDNKFLRKLSNLEALLGSYHIDDNMRLHVVDVNKSCTVGEFEDVSKVEKYAISDKDYDSKRDSVRAFLKKQKAGKYDPENQEKMKLMEEERHRQEQEALKNIQIGSRCQVEMPKQMARRGTVRFIGETDFKPNLWIGVEYDEPYGKNNGTVEGRQYFVCKDKYGAFVRPHNVKCGDYPELGLDDDDEEM